MGRQKLEVTPMNGNEIRCRPTHYIGEAFIAGIAKVLNKNDVRCYDSAIVQFIKTMSADEFKKFGVNS